MPVVPVGVSIRSTLGRSHYEAVTIGDVDQRIRAGLAALGSDGVKQEHVSAGEIPADLAVMGAKLGDDGLIEVADGFPSR